MDTFVVLSQDQFNDVFVICVCKDADYAKEIVQGRKENMPDFHCWYQKSALV